MNGAGTVAGARVRDPRRWAEGRAPLMAGAALALAAVVQIALEPLPSNTGPGAALPPKIFLVLIALAATLPLGALWTQPRTTAVIVAIASLLSLGLVHTATVAGVIAFIAAMARLSYLGAQALAGCIAVAVLISALTQPDTSPTRAVLILLTGALPLGCWVGYTRRVKRDSAVRSTQDEMMADSRLAHMMRGERARISRELHDVVAHHISMIAVQAEAARLTTQGMPPAGAQRLLAIGDTARSALTEMRRLLGVLREDAAAEQLRRPQPGLAQLNDLLDESRGASGAGTRLIVSGWLIPLDPGVELAAYRIVQEALTNARRHAPGAAIDVELRYHDGLYLRIRDNGPGPSHAAGSGGHGLLGMQERAAAVGGTLRTSPAPGGGFLVEATLPAKAAADAA
ncbi:MAG TPA: sensor histidine kinase [Streptosporangiaceae bacterium]|nr:sensor histidine kinase [Streptosporangiaceae bacterium]